MKKTLLVSAVAMAISGNAMAAEMYGNIRLGLQDQEELDVVSGKLVLGSKGSEDLGNGMMVSYGIELEHDRADDNGAGTTAGSIDSVDFDKSWVAIGGDFGTVTAGRKGDFAGWVCGGTDILTFGAAEACSLGHNTEFDDAIMYTGGAGAIEFGVIITADGTDADQDTSIGAKFDGGDFTVGFASWEDEANDATKTQIGATYQMGDIGLGLTIGDNDAANDSGGTDLGLSMPLAGGTLKVVVSIIDTDDSDSFDVEWGNSLGRSAYYGVEINTVDNDAIEDTVTAFIGTNF